MTEGPIGESVVSAVNRSGGNMTMGDLKNYKVKISDPAYGTYRGYHIYSTPPASSGGTHIVQLLNILENFPIRSMKHNSPQYLHTLSEAMKLVFADRGKYMADTAFVDVPLRGLTSKDYAKKLAGKIEMYKVMQEVQPGDHGLSRVNPTRSATRGRRHQHNPPATSPWSTKKQHCPSTTPSTTSSAPSLCLRVRVRPQQRDGRLFQNPRASMLRTGQETPFFHVASIVLDPHGQPFMTLGAAGAMRIITAVTQIIMNVVDFGMHMD